MIRKETEKALTEAKITQQKNGLSAFRTFCLIYEIKLYESCLNRGVDPDSILFYYDAEEGKGIKWE